MTETEMQETVRAAIGRIGGSKLAALLGCSKQLVSHWRVGRYRVPAETAKDIERLTDGQIHRAELRPDLWDLPCEKEAA